MDNNYAMLFEELTLAPWGGGFRSTDPFKMADADTFRLVRNSLNDGYGENARFILYAAITKAKVDHAGKEGVYETMGALQQQVWKAETLNDLIEAMRATKAAFESVGYVIVA